MAFSDTNTVGFIIGIIGLVVAGILYVAILWRSESKLLQALILLGVLDSAVLIGIPFFDTILPPFWNGYNKTTISFDGKMTFSDGKLMFVINNNDQNLHKYLDIYGMDNKNSITLQTRMTDAAGTIQNYVTFDDTKTQLTITKVAGDPQKIDLHVNIPSGLFQGWIIISGKNPTSIPITVATDPKTAEAVGWIVVGILTSIIIWEVILYFKPPKPGAGKLAAEVAAEATNLAAAAEVSRAAARGQSNTVAAKQAKDKLAEILSQKKKAAEDYKAQYMNLRFPTRTHTRGPIPSSHVWLLDILTIFFGIAIGLLAVFSQGYVNELRVIGAWDIVALLGLGLGIGSIHSQS
jgi:hypothetical protein